MGCCVSKVEAVEDPPAVRGCTDVLWFCIFVAFWSLMIAIAAFSFVYGSPLRLINGYDSFGNTCGVQNKRIGDMEFSGKNMIDKRYLFYMDTKEFSKAVKICVKLCPTRNMNTLEDIRDFYKETGSSLCNYNFDYNTLDRPEIKNQRNGGRVLSSSVGQCSNLPVYYSEPILNRCVPKPVTEIAQDILKNFYQLFNSWDTLEQVLGDLYNTWKELLALSLFALVVSLLTVSVLHLMATVVSMIIMALLGVTSIAGTAFLWYTYYEIRTNLDKERPMLLEAARNETAFFWYSIVATVITVILLLLMMVMCKRVDVLAELFKETAHCLAAVPGLFLQPLIAFIILGSFFAFWLYVVLCLATSNYMDTVQSSQFKDKTIPTTLSPPTAASKFLPLGNITAEELRPFTFVEFVDPTWVKYMWWVYFIGLIWTSEFIMACQSMVVAGAVAHWFYRTRYTSTNHVSYAVSKLLKYHLGSMAKGSFLITLFKVPRLILTYLYAKLKANGDSASQLARCLLKCCICCFYCFEKFIRYLNHNAYTVIAIDGVSFCPAAATAFEVLVSHSLQVATINSVGDFILFLGKCFVTAITGIVGLYFFKRNADLTFYAAPTLVTCIFAFFIAHCILSLYEMVLDTLFLCRCQNGDSIEVTTNNGRTEAQHQESEMVPMND